MNWPFTCNDRIDLIIMLMIYQWLSMMIKRYIIGFHAAFRTLGSSGENRVTKKLKSKSLRIGRYVGDELPRDATQAVRAERVQVRRRVLCRRPQALWQAYRLPRFLWRRWMHFRYLHRSVMTRSKSSPSGSRTQLHETILHVLFHWHLLVVYLFLFLKRLFLQNAWQGSSNATTGNALLGSRSATTATIAQTGLMKLTAVSWTLDWQTGKLLN